MQAMKSTQRVVQLSPVVAELTCVGKVGGDNRLQGGWQRSLERLPLSWLEGNALGAWLQFAIFLRHKRQERTIRLRKRLGCCCKCFGATLFAAGCPFANTSGRVTCEMKRRQSPQEFYMARLHPLPCKASQRGGKRGN